MNQLGAAIATWNTFAPTLPLAITPALLWIAVPLAVVAALFLVVFSCGRRALRLRLGIADAPMARPAPLLRVVRPLGDPVCSGPNRPRGPTRPCVVAAA